MLKASDYLGKGKFLGKASGSTSTGMAKAAVATENPICMTEAVESGTLATHG